MQNELKMENPSPLDVVRSVYANFAAGDISTVLKMLADNVDWKIIGPEGYPFFGHFRGREGFQSFLSDLGEATEISRFEPSKFLATDSHVIVTGSETGCVRRTGKSYDVAWCHIFTIEDGQVVAFEEYLDTAPIVIAYDAK
jgi:uncharacterized protein